MEYNYNMIIIKGKPNNDVASYQYNKKTNRYDVMYKGGGPYHFAPHNFQALKNPSELDIKLYKFENNGVELDNIDKVFLFEYNNNRYFRIYYANGRFSNYRDEELTISHNALSDCTNNNFIAYYKAIASKTGMMGEQEINILKEQYEKMTSLDENSVLATYLSKEEKTFAKAEDYFPVIFPFGCNLSQITAVKNAVHNKISVIEGPPGTGKTQTILNILANIIIRGKTVAVVSNNNSATDNVYEKLEKYGFEYIAAQLGNSQNKTKFIEDKQKPYPNFDGDIIEKADILPLKREIIALEENLVKRFEAQNRMAKLKQDLAALMIEKQYFDEYFTSTYSEMEIFRDKNKLSTKMILELWARYQEIVEQNKKIGLIFKLKSMLFYSINDFSLFKKESGNIIALLKKHFYEFKINEITEEIDALQAGLESYSFENSIKTLTEKSLVVLKSVLAEKFAEISQRKKFEESDLFQKPCEFLHEYPIVLSTAYSLRRCLKGIMYDYVIVDEASQVDLATGVLAMSCAKNMVVVGDLKQLPNVIKDVDKKELSLISSSVDIPIKYRYENQSLLSSVCSVFLNAPKILLKEHYRCHPKIINYCNQKFYNNELIIMSADNDESDVLKAYVTASGNHARGRFNQRQIDEIKTNILPELDSSDVGVITPYRDQTDALDNELAKVGDIDISTVHKFQGREKDDIIISTVDNEITEFTDNPNMLNVAVSRAKNRLRLVLSDSEKNEKTNIGDLVKYIEYNNFEVKSGDVFSVFDILYKSLEEQKVYLAQHKRVSQYNSENIMYALITEVLSQDKFSKFDVVTHQLLNGIIRDPYKLTDEETAYAMSDFTHVDFLLFNKMDKSMILAVEVDGYSYHKKGSKQKERDDIKDIVLRKYDIPLIRFSTVGSSEKERLEEKLTELLECESFLRK